MRIHKVVNRIYEGTTYYRWLISVRPKDVRELGWVDGQPLEATVRGSTLWISPASPTRVPTRERAAGAMQERIQRKSVAQG